MHSGPKATRLNAHSGPRMAKTVKPYDACPELLGGEADLHRGQHQGHEDGGSDHPGKVIVEETAIVVPAAEGGVELRETSDSGG